MPDTPAPFDRRRSREVGRGRTLALRKRLVRVCDVTDLEDLVTDSAHEPDHKALSRILCRMRDRRQVYKFQIEIGDFVGPERNVWCLYRMSSVAHDNALTKVMKALGWPEEEKPTHIESVGAGDDRVRPDAVTLFPKKRLWEMDMDTEREEEIRKKVKALMLQQDAVLWICPTEARRQKLIAWTTEIHDRSFYALWSDLIATPRGEVWKSAKGNMRAFSFVPKDVQEEERNDVPTN